MALPRKIISMFVISVLFLPILSFAASVSLPQTGQKICYDEAGAVTSCPGTGQDGEIQAGVAWPTQRFNDNEDGTITDNLTGLIWARDASAPTIGTCDGGGGYLYWQQALDYIECLNINNYLNKNTWRLPNVNELESLIVNDTGGLGISWFPQQGFTGVQDSSYWTSTTAPYSPYFNQAFTGYGGNGQVYYNDKKSNSCIWPVSGTSNGPARIWKTGQTTCYDEDGAVTSCAGTGQDGEYQAGTPWPNPRFAVIHCDANGPCADQSTDCDEYPNTDVVIDNLTGLMWPRNGNLLSSYGMAWNDALLAVKNMNEEGGLCGFTGWHLPNEKQLHSLSDYSHDNPSLLVGHPFLDAVHEYWSSTSFDAPGQTQAARTVHMWLGNVGGAGKTYTDFFWPVRVPAPGSDIWVTKRDLTDPAEVGHPFTYTVTVTNLGPDDATGVTLTDNLPSQVVFGSATPTQGTCGQAGGVVTCNIGGMNAGETVIVTVIVTAPGAPITVTNTATATSASSDPNSSNNTATETTRISNTYFNLTVSKDGLGTVTGSGIDCGSDCTETYLEQTVVILRAIADTGSVFTGWTGGGCSGLGKCRVTMDGTKNVTATFGPRTSVIQLPQTGQTAIYATGDDGNMRAGVPWPSPRFTNNGDGTITDELTGLTWLKDGNCIRTEYPNFDNDSTAGDGAVSWEHALDFVKGINDGTYPYCGAGQTDWRLPNANELNSLAHAGYANPLNYLFGQGFRNLNDTGIYGAYWTSTPDASYALQRWAEMLSGGYLASTNGPCGVLPVRGTTSDPAAVRKTGVTVSYYPGDDGAIQAGVAWPSPRFTEHADGTVTDELTGLIWLKDTNCMATQYPEFDADYTAGDGKVYWQHALAFVNGINAGTHAGCGAGYTNWRLPNLNEIQSLTDFSRYYPALPEGHPFANLSLFENYWTSTTSASDSTSAYMFSPAYGSLFSIWKTAPYDSYVAKAWPVRSTQVVASADLLVSKTDSPDPILISQPITYTVTVTNHGPSVADGVTLTDTLPDGVVFVSANSTQGTCNQAAGTVTCSIGSMPNLAVVTVTIVINAPGSPGSITNTATVSSTTNDPDNSNNTATANTTVKTAYDVDLTVMKSDSPDPVEIGHNVTYMVTVTNNGPDMASGVVLTDTLPAGMGFVSADSTQATCGHVGLTVTCTIGTMLKDAVVTITIVATAPGSTGTITNTATVSSTSNDSNSGNNTTTTSTAVYLNSGDISVSLSEYPNPAYAGQQVTYTATLANSGPDTAKGVTLTDTLPAGTGFKSVSSTQGTCSESAGSITCNIGDMANGATVTVTILVNAPTSAGPITNTATAASTNNDSNLSNNTDSEMTDVILLPPPMTGALNLARTGQISCYDVSGNPINCIGTGQDGEFRAGIAWPSPRFVDNGNGTLTDSLTGLMWLKDANCIGTQYPGYDASPPGDGLVTYYGALGFIYLLNGHSFENCSGGHHDWRLPNVNELESLINVSVSSQKNWLGSQGFMNLQNIYWSSTTFPTYINNAYIFYTNFGEIQTQQKFGIYGAIEVAGVLLVRGVSNGPAPVWRTGQTVSYEDPLYRTDGSVQAGVAWPSPRFTDNSDGTVTDKLTGLVWLKDANCIHTQYPSFDGDGTAGDGAVVWQHAFDFVAGINSGTFRNCGQPYTDWRLPNRKELFSLMDYSLPGLPSGHPFVNVPTYPSYWSSSSSGIPWSVFFWDGVIPHVGYDSAIYVWPVRGGTIAPPYSADLSITKSASANSILGGTNLTYTIGVTNNGPGAASGVTMQDTLPPGTTFILADPTSTCSHSGGTVYCNLGSMANGATVTVTVVVTVPNTAGWIRNVATVGPLAVDPFISNNTTINDTRVYTPTDSDSDGVSGTEESGPSGTTLNYDGNIDGIAASTQTNVTSMHTFDGSNYLTIASLNGTSLSNVQANTNPSPGNSPAGVTFPYGFFAFTVEGVTPGGSTTVTIYLPAGANPNTYYKYGPEPWDPTNHWYEFLYNGQTGAVIIGNMITLYFVDGLRGDDDLTANGLIVDQGAPGFIATDQTGPSLSITSHTNNQDVSTASITLSGTASDSGKGDNGIQQVTVNGIRANNDTATETGTANWSKVVSLSPGANSITVIAYDNSPGHNQISQTITIYYDLINTIYICKDNWCNGHSHCWPNIQNGLTDVLGPSIIEISQETYDGDIVLNVDEEIILEGGWDTNFESCPSYTTIHGSVTITHGTIIIENIIVK